jgi:hypothetical protein
MVGIIPITNWPGTNPFEYIYPALSSPQKHISLFHFAKGSINTAVATSFASEAFQFRVIACH